VYFELPVSELRTHGLDGGEQHLDPRLLEIVSRCELVENEESWCSSLGSERRLRDGSNLVLDSH
jgi:hypothetical protein